MHGEIALLSKARSGASSTASDAIEPIADRAPGFGLGLGLWFVLGFGALARGAGRSPVEVGMGCAASKHAGVHPLSAGSSERAATVSCRFWMIKGNVLGVFCKSS